jgi:hypothetical protein
MSSEPAPENQTYNPWTVVKVVFDHLAAQGLSPTLGPDGDPGPPAVALLRTLGIVASVEGDARVSRQSRAQLAELRTRMLDRP